MTNDIIKILLLLLLLLLLCVTGLEVYHNLKNMPVNLKKKCFETDVEVCHVFVP